MKETLKRLLASIDELENDAPPEKVSQFIRNQYQAGRFNDDDCQVMCIVYEISLKEKFRKNGEQKIKFNAQLTDF